MVVVRESPRAKVSPDKAAALWPPKSPFQALLSSPNGRKKWQDHTGTGVERSPSPSPVKRPLSSAGMVQALSGDSNVDMADREDLDEEEHNAMLELEKVKLELRLNKIRKQKQKKLAEVDGRVNSAVRKQPNLADRPHILARGNLPRPGEQPSAEQPNVEVPTSPVRRPAAPIEQLSPARKRLGLASVPRAQNVSLKRPRDGIQSRRSDVMNTVASSDPRNAPLSFNERLRASKTEADVKDAKYARIERSRSKAFDFKPEVQTPLRSDTTRREQPATDGKRPSSARGTQSARGLGLASTTKLKQASAASYDPFSEIHLSKRHVPHVDVARAVEQNEIYMLPRLLKEVKAPDYDPPDCESDFVVFAILASKSSPFDQKQKHKTSDEGRPQEDATAPRNKFMVLKLCDLKWEIDCFLFGTAFDQFWKLTPGTLLAILNPAILPPKGNQQSGRFSLKLGSSEDCVMEIGVARDLGYCTSVKKDGEKCGEWVDKRSTEICEFHLNLFIEKQRKSRMEVNTMWRGHGGTSSKSNSRELGDGEFDRSMKYKRGMTVDRECGRLYTVNTGMGRSAASLLDAEGEAWLDQRTGSEMSRKRIAAAEKERELQKELKKLLPKSDESVGAEYMRACNHVEAAPPSDAMDENTPYFAKPSAAELGLLSNRASAVHMSPAKDRKAHFGLGALSTTTGRDAVGWGGARNAKLLQPKEISRSSPAKGQTKLNPAVRARSRDGTVSPSKKRARFMLAEKGLREPGRESGGVRELNVKGLGDDDDDDLDIV
ncbi:hypothetical protein BAUCODRAFT_76916 [Baudoinia panamericana UAMH 10762]|uniref:Uncharacterized protein n=1 Tax=Baudoinia panamericana (strain UAMH 10762) TaxID=717646 RepID=M2M9K9_BAUPA|nr:uncharacterized protein BAUCODRAFT_76916 [Baudoinia panamericana UAMH 10762]EMC93101.1 hypothetical protein BAUCODRAFT_76916 [Baudoinia panamericana UAMH 10762]